MRLHHIALGAILASALAVSGCGATKDQGAGDSSSAAAGSAAPATGLRASPDEKRRAIRNFLNELLALLTPAPTRRQPTA